MSEVELSLRESEHGLWRAAGTVGEPGKAWPAIGGVSDAIHRPRPGGWRRTRTGCGDAQAAPMKTTAVIVDALVDLAKDVADAELAHASLRSPYEKGLGSRPVSFLGRYPLAGSAHSTPEAQFRKTRSTSKLLGDFCV